uniref:Uncharacterized protein n=1 Tax=Octopus bimaculoides TaxID=37653 RepID=A0A0L8G783_OCTBM
MLKTKNKDQNPSMPFSSNNGPSKTSPSTTFASTAFTNIAFHIIGPHGKLRYQRRPSQTSMPSPASPFTNLVLINVDINNNPYQHQ